MEKTLQVRISEEMHDFLKRQPEGKGGYVRRMLQDKVDVEKHVKELRTHEKDFSL